MQNKTETTSTRLRTMPRAVPAPVRSSPDWKPEPCGLTREEVRKIIADQLG